MNTAPITTLFLDIGGVLLTNGWDTNSRKKAFEHFDLDAEEVEERHHLTFSVYEEGRITLDEYLDRTVFYEERSFSKASFKGFMYNESKALPGSIDYFKQLKQEYRLKVIAVSNEAKELNEHRIKTFKLNELFDAYISSCYVHIRKPSTEMLTMACDISQTRPEHGLYIDDRQMFVEIATKFGMQGLQFESIDKIKADIKQVNFHKSKSVSENGN